MQRSDASKHEAAINRAITAKRPFVIIGWTRMSAIGKIKPMTVQVHGIPNTIPHMEAICAAMNEDREFFVYSDFDQRYLTGGELAALMGEGMR